MNGVLVGFRNAGPSAQPAPVERDDHVDVWRLLRAERDVSAWLWEPEDP